MYSPNILELITLNYDSRVWLLAEKINFYSLKNLQKKGSKLKLGFELILLTI